MSERSKCSKLKFIFKIVNGYAPIYLQELIPVHDNNEARYNLRNNANVRQYYARTEKFRRSIFPDCIRRFNALPPNVRDSDNVHDFVTKINIPFCPNLLFYGINRKLSIIHAQFRMKCSNLNAHLFLLHVIEDPNCVCSNQIESCEHFFFHCHLYTVLRTDFIAKLRELCNIPITTNLLLFGNDKFSQHVNAQIFELVEAFIHDSGRFET